MYQYDKMARKSRFQFVHKNTCVTMNKRKNVGLPSQQREKYKENLNMKQTERRNKEKWDPKGHKLQWQR